jgi:plastocyanin
VHTVIIGNFKFTPEVLSVKPGDRTVWVINLKRHLVGYSKSTSVQRQPVIDVNEKRWPPKQRQKLAIVLSDPCFAVF